LSFPRKTQKTHTLILKNDVTDRRLEGEATLITSSKLLTDKRTVSGFRKL